MNKPNINVSIGGLFSNSPYQYKSKILLGNHSFASQVNTPDTKYIIKYDFNLDGQEINIPENCLLEFDGGSISNGTLIGNNTIIISYQDDSVIFKDVSLEGNFKYANKYTGPNLLILTEDEYDSLETYDENTIYFVKE